MRLRISGPHASVVADRRQHRVRGRMARRGSRASARTTDLPPRACDRASIASARGSRSLGRRGAARGRRGRVDRGRYRSSRRARSCRPARGEARRSAHAARARAAARRGAVRRCSPRRPGRRSGALPASRAACAAASSGAVQVDVGARPRRRSAPVVLAARLVHQRKADVRFQRMRAPRRASRRRAGC